MGNQLNKNNMVEVATVLKTTDNRVVFEISNDYRFVLIAVLVNVFVHFMANQVAGPSRMKYLSKEKLTEHFGEEHMNAGLGEITKGGYPEFGNGRYIMAMGYEAWYTFASRIRAGAN